MFRTVVAGLDGSSESRSATEWAAREARLRGLPLTIVHVWEPIPAPMAQAPLLGAETQQNWTERMPREAADAIRLRHPDMELTIEQRTGDATEALLDTAKEAELIVLGSRGLSGIGGFMVGSVGLSVAARSERPVVLVRPVNRPPTSTNRTPTGCRRPRRRSGPSSSDSTRTAPTGR